MQLAKFSLVHISVIIRHKTAMRSNSAQWQNFLKIQTPMLGEETSMCAVRDISLALPPILQSTMLSAVGIK